MITRYLGLLLIVAGSAAMAESIPPDAIRCPGTYGGHLQGIAIEPGAAIYWSFTVAIVKTDLEGRFIKQVAAPTHQGDLTWHDGKVYVAVNLGLFNEPAGKADSWVYVYNAADLSLLEKHAVPEAVHGAGGIAFHEGHFFVVGGLPVGVNENYVYEYDADFAFIKRHVVDSGYTLKGIQTVCRWNGFWWFGCYGNQEVLLKADDQFHVVGRYYEDWAKGIAGLSDTVCLRGFSSIITGSKMQSGGAIPGVPGTTGSELAAQRDARKSAAHRPRRIIMNNDGNDARTTPPDAPHTPETFLASRTTALAGSQVDAIYYCTGVFNLYTHKSDETEPRGHGDKNVADWAWALTEQGTDSLSVITDFGHAHGMEVFWSMRMNDTHDSGDDALLCRWKQEHPDYLMGAKGEKFPHGGGRWSAVNYGLPEVREKVFRILKDVCTRYSVDGIELDFYRHPVYFKPQMTGEPVTQEQCDLMTELIRRVRSMTFEVAAERGRPLLISVRIPDSPGFAKGIGLDYPRWLQEDLIDMVVGSGYFHFEPWENLVKLGHQYEVPVYACLSGSRVVSSKNPGTGGADSMPLWQGEADLAWKAGVDGIYTFNVFDPNSPLFRTLGSPDTLIKSEVPHKPITGEKKAMERWLKGGSQFVKIPE